MRQEYEKQMRELKNNMIKMGEVIEQAISSATKALVNQDMKLAQTIIQQDEVIDMQKREVENLCFKLLLHQQPVATDLRRVSAALKMITDMERIGDHAADISEITVLLHSEPYIKKLDHIQKMAVETIAMVVQSVQAYVEMDQQKAQEIISRDDVVDELFDKVKHELIERIAIDKQCGEQATDLLMIAKYYERIGDHATNIAEWVIYMITGDLA